MRASETTETDGQSLEVRKKLAELRARMRESFGTIAMSLMAMPRYKHQSLADMQHLILDPLMQDRIALAYPTEVNKPEGDIAGIAIWASVSEEVDAKIREQVRAGTFPIRLKAEDWNSGEINWLFDVIAPDQQAATRVLANFKQVAKGGDLRLHPLIARIVDKDTLAQMGATATPPGETLQ